MDMEEMIDINSINCLPDEVVSLILQRTYNPQDILHFGATCKHYNVMIKSDRALWKITCAKVLPSLLYEFIERHRDNNWFQEIKYYSLFKQDLHSELNAMSARHYWKLSERSLDSVSNFFAKITKNNFLYAINILQDVLKKGNVLVERRECIKPYTLTEMYYTKTVLRHFIHTFLTVKWAKDRNERNLRPELVTNFFLQWIDPSKLYLDEEVEAKINVLINQVNKIFENDKRLSKNRGIDIIQVVTHVIYKQTRMALTTAADLDSLDIRKVIDNRCGNVIVVAAIYQAVASRCGACCELIVFPNHLFLEWTDETTPGQPLYNIDIGTGDVYPKRQCPYASRSALSPKYTYCPNALLQYIYSSFIITMGALKTWHTQNAMLLLEFLGIEDDNSPFKHNPYINYLPTVMESEDIIARCENVSLRQLSDEHIKIIMSLANSNVDDVPTKRIVSKKHAGNVKFAVGMICYHKRYDYVCIVRGWDVTGCQLHFPLDDLYFGRNQPFYYITAADQSERYVAQENLMELIRPTRLYHLEHQISRDFTHYDGFAYVPNQQKKLEYPEDHSIVEVFRVICQQNANYV